MAHESLECEAVTKAHALDDSGGDGFGVEQSLGVFVRNREKVYFKKLFGSVR